MKLATWNVNSIRAREERLVRWLAANQPDVLCLQELKVADDAFPTLAIQSVGYHAAVHGQKTYNGVAILSRAEPSEVERGFGDGGDDSQARLVTARVSGLRVICAYVPNGAEVGSDKWAYKLEWLGRLRAFLDLRFRPGDALALCGDFNVAPEPRDVCDPAAWEASVRRWGLVDAFRMHHEAPGFDTWWDYCMLAFPRNQGLRIDHVFLSETTAATCRAALIDRNERKGKQPSDHAPIVVEL